MRIAVLGAGNGGLAMAAHMIMKGHRVTVYDKYAEALAGVIADGGIRLHGALGEGFFSPSLVSATMEDVIDEAELIMVVTPAFAHGEIAAGLASFLTADQIVILHPGRTGGALECRRVIREIRPDLEPVIAEAQTLLYASRRTGPSDVTIYGIKKQVGFAALPARRNEAVAKKLQAIFAEFSLAATVLETSLLNIGAIFHPAPTLLNAARIESTAGNFEYYHEGISPAVGKVLERLDGERIEIAQALGVATRSAVQWLHDVYGAGGADIFSAVRANRIYGGIKAPPSLDTRYISEDVPMSLVPLSELGALASVRTPVMDMMIGLAGIMHKTDYRSKGRTLQRMGIADCAVEQLKERVL